MVFFTGKNGYTRTRGLRTRTRHVRPLPVPDQYSQVRPVRVGSCRVYPRVRVDPHTSNITDIIGCGGAIVGLGIRSEESSGRPHVG